MHVERSVFRIIFILESFNVQHLVIPVSSVALRLHFVLTTLGLVRVCVSSNVWFVAWGSVEAYDMSHSMSKMRCEGGVYG